MMDDELGEVGLDAFQRWVGTWGEATFGRSTPASVIEHLADEVAELRHAERGTVVSDHEAEAADCLLLLLHYAHKRGFSLFDAAARKFDVNRRRRWDEPDARGVVRHIG